MHGPRLLLWLGGALAVGVLALACATCPSHPKQMLDAPCGPFVDPARDYEGECVGEETCVERADGSRECWCAYTREGTNG